MAEILGRRPPGGLVPHYDLFLQDSTRLEILVEFIPLCLQKKAVLCYIPLEFAKIHTLKCNILSQLCVAAVDIMAMAMWSRYNY